MAAPQERLDAVGAVASASEPARRSDLAAKLAVQLTPAQRRSVDEEAERRGIPKSEIVRDVVAVAIGGPGVDDRGEAPAAVPEPLLSEALPLLVVRRLLELYRRRRRPLDPLPRCRRLVRLAVSPMVSRPARSAWPRWGCRLVRRLRRRRARRRRRPRRSPRPGARRTAGRRWIPRGPSTRGCRRASRRLRATCLVRLRAFARACPRRSSTIRPRSVGRRSTVVSTRLPLFRRQLRSESPPLLVARRLLELYRVRRLLDPVPRCRQSGPAGRVVDGVTSGEVGSAAVGAPAGEPTATPTAAASESQQPAPRGAADGGASVDSPPPQYARLPSGVSPPARPARSGSGRSRERARGGRRRSGRDQGVDAGRRRRSVVARVLLDGPERRARAHAGSACD